MPELVAVNVGVPVLVEDREGVALETPLTDAVVVVVKVVEAVAENVLVKLADLVQVTVSDAERELGTVIDDVFVGVRLEAAVKLTVTVTDVVTDGPVDKVTLVTVVSELVELVVLVTVGNGEPETVTVSGPVIVTVLVLVEEGEPATEFEGEMDDAADWEVVGVVLEVTVAGMEAE